MDHATPKVWDFPVNANGRWWCWKCINYDPLKGKCPLYKHCCNICKDSVPLHYGTTRCTFCNAISSDLCIANHSKICTQRRNRWHGRNPRCEKPCKNCRIPHDLAEPCHITVPTKSGRNKHHFVYAADFESALDPIPDEPGLLNHTVNLAVARRIDFDKPIEQWDPPIIVNTAAEFVRYFMDLGHSCQIWFHNFSGYDGRFIFFELTKYENLEYSVMAKGSRFMQIKVKVSKDVQLTFRDFMLHCPGSLAKNAQAYLGVKDNDGKQFFPYTFNTTMNVFLKYNGPWPDMKHYEPELMPTATRAKFLVWYEQQKSKTFDLIETLRDYCVSDVNLLARVMVKYEKSMVEQNNLSPLDSTTLPSYSFKLWKLQYYLGNELYKLAPMYPLSYENYSLVKKAYRGGKTDVRRLYYERDDDESLRYVDFNSMYPACMLETEFPVGQPKMLRDQQLPPVNDPYWKTDFIGIVCVDIKVTGYMHHPLLCSNVTSKLTFDLHDLTQTVICSIELSEALTNYKYELVKVHWAFEYPKKHKLFECIEKWYSQRQLYKSNAATAKSLGRDSLEWSVKADCLKLLMNSLYGKFGENPNKLDLVIDKLPLEKDRPDERDGYRWVRGFPVNQTDTHKTYTSYYAPDESSQSNNLKPTNVVIAAFITAQGRIRLNKALSYFGTKILYHDTDSFIFVDDQNVDLDTVFDFKVTPELDLGLLKDELEGEEMSRFIALAPKTYAYETENNNSTKQVIKMKGVQKNYSVDSIIDFEAFKRLLDGTRQAEKLPQRQFTMDMKKQTMTSRIFNKIFQFNKYDLKGEYSEHNYFTFPFGYERFEHQWPIELKQAKCPGCQSGLANQLGHTCI